MKRIALITGAVQGVGRAIAERLGSKGIYIILADRQADVLRETAAQIAATGAEAMALPLDVTDEAGVAEAFAEIDRRFGRLDMLVNNAGLVGLQNGQRATVENMTLETWQTTLPVNLTGPFLMCRSAVPLMRRNRWGRIVNIASTSARGRPPVSNSNYSASKTALVGMTHVLANEVGADSITVNSFAPSRILTPMTLAAAHGDMNYFQKSASQTAVGRLAEPADIANAVAFLYDEASSFVTGAIIDVTVAPSWLDDAST